MQYKTDTLIPHTTYHVYNRANGNEKLFRNTENYNYFLRKYEEYISPIADTFCYCLMPNHFHFLIRIKSEEELATLTGFKTLSGLLTSENQNLISKHLSLQFSHLFNSYSQAFNKQVNRKGALFMRPFKRIRVDETNYLLKLVHYIHLNPVKSKLCDLPQEWQHSSYSIFISNKPSFISRSVLISWFDDLENFKYIHTTGPELDRINF